MTKFNISMFESIKDSLLKKTTSSSYQDFLKLEIGKTYLVRILPNTQNLDRTFYHYFNHMWTSLATNQLISVLCPTTVKERCPIDEYRFRIYRNGSEAEKEQSKILRRNENWLVNVYVISDPSNPENEGKVKILRYGKQLDKIIQEAMSGDDAETFGAKIFDLSDQGCNLRIKVEKNEGGYATYVSSKFLPASPIPGVSNSEEKMSEIYESVKELDTVFESKSYDDIQTLLDVHFFGKQESNTKPAKTVEKQIEITHTPLNTSVKHTVEVEAVTSSSEDEDLSEEERKMREILNGL